MELWDLYTENREPTGEIHIRGEELPDDRYHLVVDIWLVNREGKFLLSQRDENRPTFPLMWECSAGGSVLKGETSLEGALREVKEEIGVELDPETGRCLCSKCRKIINGKKFNDFKEIWLFPYDGEVDLSQATEREVADVKWLSPDEIQEYLNEGKMVASLSYFFDDVLTNL